MGSWWVEPPSAAVRFHTFWLSQNTGWYWYSPARPSSTYTSTAGGAPALLLGVAVPLGWNMPCFSNAQRMTLRYAPPVRFSLTQSPESAVSRAVSKPDAVAGFVAGVSVPIARRIRYVVVRAAKRCVLRSAESPPNDR